MNNLDVEEGCLASPLDQNENYSEENVSYDNNQTNKAKTQNYNASEIQLDIQNIHLSEVNKKIKKLKIIYKKLKLQKVNSQYDDIGALLQVGAQEQVFHSQSNSKLES